MDILQTRLQKAKAEENQFKKEVADVQTNISQLDANAKRCRDLINDLEFRLRPIKVSRV